MVQDNTVAVMGPYKQLDVVRSVVLDCMHNIHPIYRIKELMLRRELAKDPNLAQENWERYLPQFTKRHAPRKKVVIKEKKEYTPFPPEQLPRKEDIAMATGAFWLKKDNDDNKKKHNNNNATAAKRKSPSDDIIIHGNNNNDDDNESKNKPHKKSKNDKKEIIAGINISNIKSKNKK